MKREDKEHFYLLVTYTCITLVAWMLAGLTYEYFTK
jgi:hypothetical protein